MNVQAGNNPIVPSQFEQIRLVYEAIVAASWFYDSEESRQNCADLVMRRYRMGITDTDALMRGCVDQTRQGFQLRVGLEKASTISVSCEASCEHADVGDGYPGFC